MRRRQIFVAVFAGLLGVLFGSFQMAKAGGAEEINKLSSAGKTKIILDLIVHLEEQRKIIDQLGAALDIILKQKHEEGMRFNEAMVVSGDPILFNKKPVIVALDHGGRLPAGFVKTLTKGILVGTDGEFVEIYALDGFYAGKILTVFPNEKIGVIILKSLAVLDLGYQEEEKDERGESIKAAEKEGWVEEF